MFNIIPATPFSRPVALQTPLSRPLFGPRLTVMALLIIEWQSAEPNNLCNSFMDRSCVLVCSARRRRRRQGAPLTAAWDKPWLGSPDDLRKTDARPPHQQYELVSELPIEHATERCHCGLQYFEQVLKQLFFLMEKVLKQMWGNSTGDAIELQTDVKASIANYVSAIRSYGVSLMMDVRRCLDVS